MEKVYKLKVTHGVDYYTMFGTKSAVRNNWSNGAVFNILEHSTSNEFYVRMAGTVFVAHNKYEQVSTAKAIELFKAEKDFQKIKSNNHVRKAN